MSRAGVERMDFSGVRWRGSRKSGGNHAGMTPSPSPEPLARIPIFARVGGGMGPAVAFLVGRRAGRVQSWSISSTPACPAGVPLHRRRGEIPMEQMPKFRVRKYRG